MNDLDARKATLRAHLNVWQEEVDPCGHGHTEHTAADHQGRRLVHALAGPFGADWDVEDAIAFIEAADAIGPMGFTAQALNGHVAVRSGGRTVAFETRQFDEDRV